MYKVLAEVIVEGGSTVPATSKIFSPRFDLSYRGERAPHGRADHGTGDELIGISTGKQILWAGIGSRVLKRRIAFKAGEVGKAIEQITKYLQSPAIRRIGAIRFAVTVIGAGALVADGRGRVPLDPIEAAIFQ